jgi:hypothetical protein
MIRPLSDFPVAEIDGHHVVQVADWKSQIPDHAVRWNGRPARHEASDLWIVTSSAEDAAQLAKLVQRRFQAEDPTAPRERVVTTKRQPTFAGFLDRVPSDVAYWFSASRGVDDQRLIQALHPAPPRVNERISWAGGEYEIASLHGYFRETLGSAPRPFAARLAEARERLLERVGPGVDTSPDHLNASPVLAALLPALTRPAAEAVAHWMDRLGTGEIDALVLPGRALASDLPVRSLRLESLGVNLHAGFMLSLDDVRVTDLEATGLAIPDTAATGLDEMARRGDLRLSQIVDLPGAELVRVTGLHRVGERWTARLDPPSVRVDAPRSEIRFDAGPEMERLAEEGNEIGADAAMLLSQMGRERAEFVLLCVEDGSYGRFFDVSAWCPSGMRTRMTLHQRTFSLEAESKLQLAGFLEDVA